MAGHQQVVMGAILRLRGDAYGVTIHAKANDLGRPRGISLGAVYYALDRLEDQGLVSSRLADPAPERGGRAKCYYRLEGLGERAPVPPLDLLEEVTDTLKKEAGLWGQRRPKWVPVRPDRWKF